MDFPADPGRHRRPGRIYFPFQEHQGDRLVGKVLDDEGAYWIFSGLNGESFHWENIFVREDGTRELVCEIFGKRMD